MPGVGDRARAARTGLDAALALAIVATAGFWPRRVPDLRRWTASPDFTALHAVIAAWLDRHLELVEAGAPWLRPVGRRVVDRAETSTVTRPFQVPRDPLSVTCTRQVVAVYGCDGALPDQVAVLARVLGSIGWGARADGDRTVPAYGLGSAVPPAGPLQWRPTTVLALPAGLETTPPGRRLELWHGMWLGLGWLSRGEPGIIAPGPAEPADPTRADPLCQPVEVSGPLVAEVAAEALAQHEHAIAIDLSGRYYVNASATSGPDRLPGRALPVSGTRRPRR